MTCSKEGCGRPVIAREFCNLHYRRFLRYGSPDKPKVTEKCCNRCGQNKSVVDEFYSTRHGTCKRCCSILGTCRKLGISFKGYHRKLQAQGGCCAVCHEPFTERASPHLDHNHATGELRGFLCRRCNFLLGFVEAAEAPLDVLKVLLQNMEVYLKHPPFAKYRPERL